MSQRRLAQLTKLAAAFPRDRVRESTLAVYVSELRDMSDVEFEAVVCEALNFCSHWPTIAELRQKQVELREQRAELEARERYAVPALDAPYSPMPDYIKKQIADLKAKMDVSNA